MNLHIQALAEMAARPYRNIIGLMSGTSLDGLDIAYCRLYDYGRETKVEVLAFATMPYASDTKDKIKQVFAQDRVDLPYLALLNEWIGTYHGQLVNEFVATNNIDKNQIDIIASHGQTVMHVPKHRHAYKDMANATLQIGDGDHLAYQTGIITISDFRQKHIAAGGEGAPLAVYGDYLMFTEKGENRVMLNIGGISNFTYLPSNGDATMVFVTDTGPGNTLMDAYMKKYFNANFDQDGQVASQGMVQPELLKSILNHPFFALELPKTTGPELFNLSLVEQALRDSNCLHINHFDIMATLNKLTAVTIANAIKIGLPKQDLQIFVSGGGAHNVLLMDNLQSELPQCNFQRIDSLGMNGDAKEAVLFALLANECIGGKTVEFNIQNKIPKVNFGKISFPN